MSKPEVIVSDIITAHLKAHGFDGLYNTYAECACKIDCLAPCEHIDLGECKAGYLQSCNPECGCGDWHIGAGKDDGGDHEEETHS
jgi:hypothetical protein